MNFELGTSYKLAPAGGQMVTYDNRRLLAAQNAGLNTLEINTVQADELFSLSEKKRLSGINLKKDTKMIEILQQEVLYLIKD